MLVVLEGERSNERRGSGLYLLLLGADHEKIGSVRDFKLRRSGFASFQGFRGSLLDELNWSS